MSGYGIDRQSAAPEPGPRGLREELSALVDGGLDPVRARFLLRRLQHDAELAGCFERWQLAGDALRGAGPVALPAGFGPRVARAIADDAALVPAAASGSWRRPWALGALAASVAAVALFMARPVFEGDVPAPGGPAVATLPEIEVPFAPATRAPATGDAPEGRLVQAGAEAAAAGGASLAATDAPAGDTALAVAEPTTTPLPTEAADPFRSPVPPQSRPWPRAVLPGLSGRAADVFTVDHGGRVSAPPAGPFAPPVVASDPGATDAEEPAPPGQ